MAHGNGVAGGAGLPVANPIVCAIVGKGSEYSLGVRLYGCAAIVGRGRSCLVTGGCAAVGVGEWGVPSGGYEKGNCRKSRAEGGGYRGTSILPFPPANKYAPGAVIAAKSINSAPYSPLYLGARRSKNDPIPSALSDVDCSITLRSASSASPCASVISAPLSSVSFR